MNPGQIEGKGLVMLNAFEDALKHHLPFSAIDLITAAVNLAVRAALAAKMPPAYLQELVGDIYTQFESAVAQGEELGIHAVSRHDHKGKA